MPWVSGLMTHDIIRVAENFWNIRGSFTVGGVVDIGTHSSLVRRNNGRFVLLDASPMSDATERKIRTLTSDGDSLEAILHLHPVTRCM